MSVSKLSVVFLWHMHQPLYKDLLTGKYHLPWVRLHSTYSYLDMAAAVEEFPGARATFNFTPSLIWQLLDISGGGDNDDDYLALTRKKAEDLDREEACFILKNFFSCDMAKAIDPIKKYSELFHRRGTDLRREKLAKKLKEFTSQDLRDLQVYFNLAWCGFTLKDAEGPVKELLAKGSDYSEEDKTALLAEQKEVVRSILPRYRKLQDEGRIEISTTPFYHPILPLLCEGGDAGGFDFGKDAEVHVSRAIKLYEKVFGRKPRGMWPAEGSVSPEIIPLLAGNGIEWMATDEGILLESFRGGDIPREDLIYRAYTAEAYGKEIDMVFRDINISNAISFRYSAMPARKAVADMGRDLKEIFNSRKLKAGEPVTAIILDGENPWPYYDMGGKEFLHETYRMISSSPELEMDTVGGFLGKKKDRGRISDLYSGSWINRNFSKWIGSPQKDKAWKYLCKAREDLFSSGEPSPEALEELYIAEGSDWFWWYDDFGTELNFIFDELFRLHLRNLYRLIGRKPPMYLSRPIPSGPSARKITSARRAEMAGGGPSVLFVSSEAVPYAKTGGLADVAGSLPGALASMGCEVSLIMPMYRSISDAGLDLVKEVARAEHPFTARVKGFDVFSLRKTGVTTYFINNKRYFSRSGLYGTSKGDYPDNGMRFAFFSRAVLDSIKIMKSRPDLIHCNDWQTALIPFYLKFKLAGDPFFSGVKTLFSIHNMAYQGIFPKKIMKKIDIPETFFNMSDLEFYGNLNFMKSGILYSDAVSTVSHRYAEEIMTPEYGCGLDGLLRMRKDVLYGIPNGVDYSVWSPGNDSYISARYDAGDLSGKAACREDLLSIAGLDIPGEAPLVGMVSRLADQKGIDLVAGAVPYLIEKGAGIVLLGKGEEKYNKMFSSLSSKYPGRFHYCGEFNEPLAHKIEAGCDIFLMPSRYEPCGLNQMYSIKYGTIPVVRATGGLDDIIIDRDDDPGNGNGFKFLSAELDDFIEALERALEAFSDKSVWKSLMQKAMSADHSWQNSAEQYLALYREILSK
ncbi:MAG: glycogen synthase GlgA [Candidatus Omnitrophica bacterium]|nr:glycogen synthase GlgA [Candidatus Omnitrophota bacterium]